MPNGTTTRSFITQEELNHFAKLEAKKKKISDELGELSEDILRRIRNGDRVESGAYTAQATQGKRRVPWKDLAQVAFNRLTEKARIALGWSRGEEAFEMFEEFENAMKAKYCVPSGNFSLKVSRVEGS